ncbi:NADP-dependent oxidoreductase [Leuconostoc citreum]|uniref:NADP-dependent oxidoreductase n=1 Tax=Leuconostoc citreum TaxID=33964 RepID=UPI000ED9F3FB|nr:NADP-dependent oxidoreductase [Leuconostoc citreum]MCT3056241.1 NADP-dependent oxidoreductase [Leuconostoc citreum]MCT3061153.1 NADP-dependent oxidoreductase [Leuconostoc citreum]MCT3071995.1 NADP-dependent oxidoreductase [Leuconostoc citreum]MCT3073246.1 NADP-dependent oxidoreductase [Leuconostoc citreum]MCT3078103.1 NADP-dependent oxidoreductase [Leuconostoc citreum]
MYAVEMINYGDLDVLTDTQTAQRPEIKSKQVLVQQHATAIDPYDVKFRQGLMGTDKTTPLIPGSSVSGQVIAVGDEVENFSIGDRVAASTHLKSYAQYVAVSQSLLAKIPDNVSYETAAATVLGAQTGYQMVTVDLDIQPGESVLIHGGAGSVGSAAIQAARLRGAQTIYTTASSTAAAYLQAIDSQVQVIDYRTTALTQALPEGVDVILDTIGGDTLQQSLNVLKPQGRLVSLVEDATDQRVQHSYLQSNGQRLETLLGLVSVGKISIRIAKVAPFDAENMKQFQTLKHVLGKLVLTFD